MRQVADDHLPEWAVAGPERRGHIRRVAALMDDWAHRLSLNAAECARWRTTGRLHDALRDADPERLRRQVPAEFRDAADPLLHGPAAAARLAAENEADSEMLHAITHHSTGHPEFGELGRALFLADSLEPGRPQRPNWRAALRARMPESRDAVILEVVRERIRHRLDIGADVQSETIDFRNSLRGSR